jgi:PKD repeat protein
MAKALLVRSSLLAAFVCGWTACTIHPDAGTPELTGPSSFGRLLTVTATPDNITADGSISTITAVFRDASAGPLSGVPMQVSIAVNGTPVDFGFLSSRTVVTNANGEAKVVYYSPLMNGFFAGTPPREVWITVEPVGGNYLSTIPVHASIKVTPPPVPRLGAASPTPAVTYAPETPKVGDLITFDASGSQPATGHEIVDYFWDFGDGRPNDEHGSDASHAYVAAGTYTMVLGVTDEQGNSASTFRQIIVSR